eukprot:2254372-Alexandrium_andersonii.AAC.1
MGESIIRHKHMIGSRPYGQVHLSHRWECKAHEMADWRHARKLENLRTCENNDCSKADLVEAWLGHKHTEARS